MDSVNFIFRQIMTEDLGGIDYDDDAALNVGADYKKTGENATEVLVVDTDIRDNDHKKVKGINEREIEARAIAGKIRSMMEDNFRVTDKESGKLRPLQYRDIVILTRSSRGFSDVFVEILGRKESRRLREQKKDILPHRRSEYCWTICVCWIMQDRICR